MSFDDVIKRTMADIVKKRSQVRAVQAFKDFLTINGWPMGYAKETATKALRLLIQEELPDDPVGPLLDMMAGVTRTPAKLNEFQKGNLREMIKIINTSEPHKCKHEKLGIAAFIHGGGFSPMYNAPELICRNCGLNVTLFKHTTVQRYRSDFGIRISKKNLEGLNTWANDGQKRVHSSSDLTKDPIGCYNRSTKWKGPIPLKIEKPLKLESKSGL
jgi:hypothetical protein